MRNFVLFLFICQLLLGCLGVDICDQQAGISASETVLDSEIIQLHWPGNKTFYQNAFALTRQHSLYRSSDYGQTWNDEKQKLLVAKGSANPGVTYAIRTLVETSDPQKIYIMGQRTDFWTSNNGGKTYIYANSQGLSFISTILPSPHHPEEALVLTGTLKCWNYAEPGNCYYSLYVTQDFGNVWTKIDDYVISYYWGAHDRIIYRAFTTKTGEQSRASSYNSILYFTDDFGKTKTVKIEHSAGVLVKYRTVFAVQYMNPSGDLSMWYSRNFGSDQFQPIEFPGELDENRYYILDSGDDFMFIGVQQAYPKAVNLYVSDSAENSFVMSLENQRILPLGVEFGKISGMNASYVANVFSGDPSVPGTPIRTMMTLNNGGDWFAPQPPSKDSLNQTINCFACSMNFQLTGDWTSQPGFAFYSKDSALGLILATGNVGKTLSGNPDEMNTYLSRDSGISWQEVRKGSFAYEFGDHGGLIVMASNIIESSSIFYSWTEGLQWSECTMASGAIKVDFIKSAPYSTAQSFILAGTRVVNGVEKGVVMSLDLPGLHERNCTADDYEVWTISDNLGRGCTLGQTLEFQRRKQGAPCFNPQDFDMELSSAICPCSSQDYECDYCFEPYAGNSDLCVAVCDNVVTSVTSVPSPCHDYYYVSQGYRLIDGDVCNPNSSAGGLDLRPTKVKCPNPAPAPVPANTDGGPSPASIVIAILVAILVVIFIVGVLWTVARRYERFNKVVDAVKQKLPDWLQEKLDQDNSKPSFTLLSTEDEEKEGLQPMPL